MIDRGRQKAMAADGFGNGALVSGRPDDRWGKKFINGFGPSILDSADVKKNRALCGYEFFDYVVYKCRLF